MLTAAQKESLRLFQDYLDRTPREELLSDFAKVRGGNHGGPTVPEYLESARRFASSISHQGPIVPSVSSAVLEQARSVQYVFKSMVSSFIEPWSRPVHKRIVKMHMKKLQAKQKDQALEYTGYEGSDRLGEMETEDDHAAATCA